MVVPPDKLEWLFNSVQRVGQARGLVIYNIVQRPSGWGIEWYSKERQADSLDFHDGVFIAQYKATLPEALAAELARLLPET